jgi:hypothetical protein
MIKILLVTYSIIDEQLVENATGGADTHKNHNKSDEGSSSFDQEPFIRFHRPFLELGNVSSNVDSCCPFWRHLVVPRYFYLLHNRSNSEQQSHWNLRIRFLSGLVTNSK